LCHNCGACGIVCPTGALTYEKKVIGTIEEGNTGDIVCKKGILNIGEPIAIPILRELLKELPSGTNLLDSPPGASCNVVNVLHHANGAILVTEPTAFGLHDLKIAVELVKKFKIPFGLIINKYDEKNTLLDEFVDKENIDILGRIPYKREAAQTYSKGKMLIDIPEYKKAFEDIATNIEEVLLCE
jgi:MinD superfamily P-loop ATPase